MAVITITLEMADPYTVTMATPEGTLAADLENLAAVYRAWAGENPDDPRWGLGPKRSALGAAYLLDAFAPNYVARRAEEIAAEFEQEEPGAGEEGTDEGDAE